MLLKQSKKGTNEGRFPRWAAKQYKKRKKKKRKKDKETTNKHNNIIPYFWFSPI